jgi:hypothetical protein
LRPLAASGTPRILVLAECEAPLGYLANERDCYA